MTLDTSKSEGPLVEIKCHPQMMVYNDNKFLYHPVILGVSFSDKNERQHCNDARSIGDVTSRIISWFLLESSNIRVPWWSDIGPINECPMGT